MPAFPGASLPVQSAMTPVPVSAAAVRVLDVSEEGGELLALLFPQLAGLRVHRVEDTGDAVVISASCTASSECCPACGSVSARVHGGYSRTVADGAAGGRPVLIILRILRFLCTGPSCPKVTFAMQADGLTSRYCRRSVPLTQMLTGFGLELAGRAGARLAGRLGIAVHPQPRQLREQQGEQFPALLRDIQDAGSGRKRRDGRHGRLLRQRGSRKGQVSWRIPASYRSLAAQSRRHASTSRIVTTPAIPPR